MSILWLTPRADINRILFVYATAKLLAEHTASYERGLAVLCNDLPFAADAKGHYASC